MIIIYGMSSELENEVYEFIESWSEYVDMEIDPFTNEVMNVRFREEVPISYKHYGGCAGVTDFFYIGDRTFTLKKNEYERIVCN